jgi:hypothetical protein
LVLLVLVAQEELLAQEGLGVWTTVLHAREAAVADLDLRVASVALFRASLVEREVAVVAVQLLPGMR